MLTTVDFENYDKLICEIEDNYGKYIDSYIKNVCSRLSRNGKNYLQNEIKKEVYNRLMEYKKQMNNKIGG